MEWTKHSPYLKQNISDVPLLDSEFLDSKTFYISPSIYEKVLKSPTAFSPVFPTLLNSTIFLLFEQFWWLHTYSCFVLFFKLGFEYYSAMKQFSFFLGYFFLCDILFLMFSFLKFFVYLFLKWVSYKDLLIFVTQNPKCLITIP